MSYKTVSVWVKAEPFSYGALPVAPDPRLTFTNIRKIVIYARNKGSTGYPLLSYSVWKHIACNKLHITEELAWMFFSSCHVLVGIFSPVERIRWDERLKRCRSDREIDDLRCTLKIDLYIFVLYLYIQQLYRVSLRASLVAGRNIMIILLNLLHKWPSQSSISSLDFDGPGTPRSTPRNSKSLDDHSHHVFVQTHLQEILELVSSVGEDNASNQNGRPSRTLSLEAVESLGFIVAGSPEYNKTVKSLIELSTSLSNSYNTGYDKFSQHFNLHQFQQWIKDNLAHNPFSVSACIANGTRLSWPLAGDEGKGESNKRGKIATNANIVPRHHVIGNKLIIMSQVSKQTVARSSGTLELSCVKIHRSHYSYLYLLSPLRSVTIEKCRNSTVILGPVELTVHLSNCENITVIVPCRNIIVSGCTSCTLHLLTPNRPTLLSGNDSILIAPYHTYYPQLEEHMTRVGLGSDLNLWDQPLCVGPDHKGQSQWDFLPSEVFHQFRIPFEMEGPTHSIPGLPKQYLRYLSQRQKQVDNWQKIVKEAHLSRPQRKEFQVLVESRFQTWLAETGYKKELDGLVVQQKKEGRKR
ncbi:hypothetical protein LOTGIDRAFT_231523 [Lottia gigantea]|uniref:TBCC domain-containing protein 1 n=1 Tax=Lottia gigantea TaxID=225164 RepID=V4AJQ5_LOTGI|nr:hypothetical protein LOTGIDRAFT_231523 [Lottia gigantea]ESO97327.1 hypothetical protein LOTGIDRAFT_231523 [Lottia gigantea]